MGRWQEQNWEPRESGVPRRHRQGGAFLSYLPDRLTGRPLAVSAEVARQLATAERALLQLARAGATPGAAGMSRFLLRSEAIASSQIEGVAPSIKQVALAGLGDESAESRISATARLVANNIAVVRDATEAMAAVGRVDVPDLISLQRALLPRSQQLGIRGEQNWIGGSAYTPIGAEFVPPAPGDVLPLLEDLVEYLNASPHSPLIHAALVHAQFETIHPFADGNGRVGRALIHTVLARRGMNGGGVLPISAVFATRSVEYVNGLSSYRYDGDPHSADGRAGTERWLSTFAAATLRATELSRDLERALREARQSWDEAVWAARQDGGTRPPRSDSAIVALLDHLPAVVAVTARTAAELLGVSAPAARKAIEELEDVGVLHRVSIGRGAAAYIAPDVTDLLDLTERRMASTRFDTRAAGPNRPVPA